MTTTTDMYYEITGWKNDIIVISNTGHLYETEGGISLTNIKFTYTSEPKALEDAVAKNPNSAAEANETQEEVQYDLGSVYMTGEAVNLTLQTLNTPEEEPVPEYQPATFKPDYMLVKLSRDRIRLGDRVLLTVYTGSDVEALTVNGTQVTRCTYSRWTDTKIWIIELSADTVGEWDISVVAWNAAGEFSEPVTRRLTVGDNQGGLSDSRKDWIYH
jgi:hypothetical protein